VDIISKTCVYLLFHIISINSIIYFDMYSLSFFLACQLFLCFSFLLFFSFPRKLDTGMSFCRKNWWNLYQELIYYQNRSGEQLESSKAKDGYIIWFMILVCIKQFWYYVNETIWLHYLIASFYNSLADSQFILLLFILSLLFIYIWINFNPSNVSSIPFLRYNFSVIYKNFTIQNKILILNISNLLLPISEPHVLLFKRKITTPPEGRGEEK